jgi:hypothetical protein
MQLQRVLCCTYTMIFITQFLKPHINYIQSQGQPPPQGKILGAHLGLTILRFKGEEEIVIYFVLKNDRKKTVNNNRPQFSKFHGTGRSTLASRS